MTSSPAPAPQVIANDLNIYTFQGFLAWGERFLLPTLDSKLLQVFPNGQAQVWLELCQPIACGLFGAPFGITRLTSGDIVLTISPYEFGGGRLIQISPDRQISDLADLSPFCSQGGLFGLTSDGQEMAVTVVAGMTTPQITSQLLRVMPTAQVQPIADLTAYGIPFSLATWDKIWIVTSEQGKLLQVSPTGQVTEWVDLLANGLGLPLGVTVYQSTVWVTTNQGWLLRLAAADTPPAIVRVINLLEHRLGIPIAVVVKTGNIFLTTTSGHLVSIVSDPPDHSLT